MAKPGPLACNWRGALALQPTPTPPALAGSQDIPGPRPVWATGHGLIQSPALLGGGHCGRMGGLSLPPLPRTPPACSFLLLLPEGLKVPSPSSCPHLQKVCKYLLTLTLFSWGVTNACIGWQGKHGFVSSPTSWGTFEGRWRQRALIPRPVLRGKVAHWDRAGKALLTLEDPRPSPAWNIPESVSLSPSLVPISH